ncbi:pyridoxamine 5'-phosphate oxidase family protein [Candidatus Nitrospira bockiana]
MIPQEIVELLRTGVSVVVGTRDASLMPESTRAWGLHVGEDRTTVTIFLTEAISARTLENLRDNGRIAISCSRPTDHVACQLKGRLRALRPATPHDDQRRRRWARDFLGELTAVGIPAYFVEALITEPALVVEVDVTDVFLQTPGPGAGEKV